MTHTPAVSVIIPMFNASQFVGQCLESLLAQTFTDFEVIVADDCSTDSSCAVVESYAPKFNGRLKLVHTEKNSGGCAVPRNVGFKFARGEYVYFIDADDLLTLTALEELHALAESFNADVVYCEKYYEATPNLDRFYIESTQEGTFIDKPTLETENLIERITAISNRRYVVMAWIKFVRRDLLVRHNLIFPPCRPAEDDIWTYGLLCHAKKFLRSPNVVYIWRQTEQSIMRKERSPQETINFWVSPIVYGLKTLDEMLGKLEFFRDNPQYRCALLEQLVHSKLAQLFEASLALSPVEIYSALKVEFGKHLGERDVLVSWLLTDLIMQQKVFVADQQKINELERKLEEKFS